MTGPTRITTGELLRLGALAQFRREVRAGLTPTEALAFAAGMELAASCWRLLERPDEAARCTREAAAAIADAAARKAVA